MKMNDYVALENMCQLRFMEAGECFHVCTQENLPVVFHDENEFRTAMNVVAKTCLLNPEVRVYTFSIMSNHLHLVAAGSPMAVRNLASDIVKGLGSHPILRKSKGDILTMSPKLHPINSLDHLRNVIAYVHRNGPLVNPQENVFSYEWGAGKYFYNKESKLRYSESGHMAGQVEKRKLMRSHRLDSIGRICVIDGYVCPLFYCKIQEAELFFRDNRQYFHKISKNIESQKEIASLIGESIFYTDYDLFDFISSTCHKQYGVKTVTELSSDNKVELARILRYDYNASNKQISRLLKMRLETVSSLFPI